MSTEIAHDIETTPRTADVIISENIDFSALLFNTNISKGLKKHGFKKPSPIQLKAIPMGLLGYDLVIKAKSGTGKTAVFGIIALDKVDVEIEELQVIILTPTREIAFQVRDVLSKIGSEIPGLKVDYFIGGTPVDHDIKSIKQCHIAVGAPGRMAHLTKITSLNFDSVRILVLDEADALLSNENIHKDVNKIYKKLTGLKQMIASSATYPEELDKFCASYMQAPIHINLETDIPFLLGIKQFVTIVKSHLVVCQQVVLKTEELLKILRATSFTQCIIFTNYQFRGVTLNDKLKKLDWPSTYISAAQSQKERLKSLEQLQKFKCKILVTTDLAARGIDAANVDLIINFDIPYSFSTYLHRMGRAGRYGSRGMCITFAAEGKEVDDLRNMLNNGEANKFNIALYPKVEGEMLKIWDRKMEDLPPFCLTSEQMETTNIIMKEDEKIINDDELLRAELKTKVDSIDINTVKKILSEVNVKLKEKQNTFAKIDKHDERNNDEFISGYPTETITEPLDVAIKITQPLDVAMKITQPLDVAIKITEPLDVAIKEEDITISDQYKSKNINNDAVMKIMNYLLQETKESDNSEAEKSIDMLLNAINEKDSLEVNLMKEKKENQESNKEILLEMKSIKSEQTDDFDVGKKQVCSKKDCKKEMEKNDNILVCEYQYNSDSKKLDPLTKTSDSDYNSELQKPDPLLWISTKNSDSDANSKIECKCPEDLFAQAYNFATGVTNKDWLETLCQRHYEATDADVTYDEECSEEYYETNDENVGSEDQENSNGNEMEQDEEVTGTKRKREMDDPRVLYEQQFNYYADILTENAPNFTSEEEFDEYFSGWQRQVARLKRTVFDDVYKKEMSLIKEKSKKK